MKIHKTIKSLWINKDKGYDIKWVQKYTSSSENKKIKRYRILEYMMELELILIFIPGKSYSIYRIYYFTQNIKSKQKIVTFLQNVLYYIFNY